MAACPTLVGFLLLAGHAIAASAPTTAIVVNTKADSVSVVDLERGKEIAQHRVGRAPYGVVVSPDGGTVAVGVEGEEKVKFFSYPGFEPRGETVIGPMHHDHIVLSSDGRHLLVANFHSDDVVAIHIDSMKEAFRIEGASAPHVVKYDPARRLVWVTCKKVTGIASVDPIRRELVAFHQTNVNPRSLTFSPDGSKLYFGSFWVDGFFEMDATSGKVTRLFRLQPPADDQAPREVTYHGVESVGAHVVLAANEGRSYVDAVDVRDGRLLDRLTAVAKPCCIETIPGTAPVRVLVSNTADATVQILEVAANGRLASKDRIDVGDGPKRVAFLP